MKKLDRADKIVLTMLIVGLIVTLYICAHPKLFDGLGWTVEAGKGK